MKLHCHLLGCVITFPRNLLTIPSRCLRKHSRDRRSLLGPANSVQPRTLELKKHRKQPASKLPQKGEHMADNKQMILNLFGSMQDALFRDRFAQGNSCSFLQFLANSSARTFSSRVIPRTWPSNRTSLRF